MGVKALMAWPLEGELLRPPLRCNISVNRNDGIIHNPKPEQHLINQKAAPAPQCGLHECVNAFYQNICFKSALSLAALGENRGKLWKIGEK